VLIFFKQNLECLTKNHQMQVGIIYMPHFNYLTMFQAYILIFMGKRNRQIKRTNRIMII